MRQLEIFLPDEEFTRLERFNAIEKYSAPKEQGDSFGGLNRAVSWMAKCNCAILSGWRQGNTRAVNDQNNKIIFDELHNAGYGISKCRGCYAEAGKPVSTENSFFVFDMNGTGSLFFDRIKTLSERFDQDCFLYKEAGEGKQACLYGTNSDFGIGKIEHLGPMHIGSFSSSSYSRIGSGAIKFG